MLLITVIITLPHRMHIIVAAMLRCLTATLLIEWVAFRLMIPLICPSLKSRNGRGRRDSEPVEQIDASSIIISRLIIALSGAGLLLDTSRLEGRRLKTHGCLPLYWRELGQLMLQLSFNLGRQNFWSIL